MRRVLQARVAEIALGLRSLDLPVLQLLAIGKRALALEIEGATQNPNYHYSMDRLSTRLSRNTMWTILARVKHARTPWRTAKRHSAPSLARRSRFAICIDAI